MDGMIHELENKSQADPILWFRASQMKMLLFCDEWYIMLLC